MAPFLTPVSFTKASACTRGPPPGRSSRSARPLMSRQNTVVGGDHSRDQPPCQAASPRLGVRGLHCGMARARATKHFLAGWLVLPASGVLPPFFGEFCDHWPHHARPCHGLGKTEPPRPAVPLNPQTFGIAADASPVPVAIAEQPRCIKSYRRKMFRVHMGDDLF